MEKNRKDSLMGGSTGARRLVLLHSNDIHGDFMPSVRDGEVSGGLSLLSGYVRRTRQKEENAAYLIAGDMFMGSIIDQEYRGLSTIRMTNALEPDAFCIGNHEVDYGLTHLLFLEKCADFPVLCANMYIRELNRRLFDASCLIRKGDLRIRVIGLLTETITGRISQEELIDEQVSVRSVYGELERFFQKKREKADLTVLCTHLGIEDDRLLAARLKPQWGIDLIIGGHSHTLMEEPEIIGGIPVVQAGSGSGQIGRFDLSFDPKTKKLSGWKWELVRISEKTSEPDPLIDFYMLQYRQKTDQKYEKVLCTLPCEYTHPWYHRETQLMDLFADLYCAAYRTDLFILSSNSLRVKYLGPVVRRKDLKMALPYDNEVFSLSMSGSRLEAVIRHFLRRDAWEGAEVFFLFSGDLYVEVEKEDKTIRKLLFRDAPLEPERSYTLGVTSYARKNLSAFLGIVEEELGSTVQLRRLSANDKTELEEYLLSQESLSLTRQGRLVTVE